jgi:hypothetical protein
MIDRISTRTFGWLAQKCGRRGDFGVGGLARRIGDATLRQTYSNNKFHCGSMIAGILLGDQTIEYDVGGRAEHER